MIVAEADRLREWFDRFEPTSILNIGSSTHRFRTVEQPFQATLFAGRNVTHVDAKQDTGVDVVYKVGEGRLSKIVHGFFDVVLLSSVLEHVEDRDAVMRDVAAIVRNLLIVTVPHVWPYHPDPIDNLYRPTPQELTDYVCSFGFESVVQDELFDDRGSCSAIVVRKI